MKIFAENIGSFSKIKFKNTIIKQKYTTWNPASGGGSKSTLRGIR
jgi:hypothetical protein